MNRRGLFGLIAALVVACVVVAWIWNARLDIPSPRPWWYGKKAMVHVEIWEGGRGEAAVAVTLPKQVLDAFHVFGLPSGVSCSTGHGVRRVEFYDIWSELQRLPRGKRLEIKEGRDRSELWIDVPDGS